MPVFNGLEINADAHRIAMDIQRRTGCQTLDSAFSIVGNGVQGALRQLYSATGGNRSQSAIDSGTGYNPSNAELKAIYNGAFTGAQLLAKNAKGERKAPETKAPEAAMELVEDVPGSPEALAKLLAAAMGGGQKLNPEAVKAMANEAVNAKVGEILSSMGALVAEEVAKSVRKVEIKIADLPKVEFDATHKCFERILRYAAQRINIMVVGPAGSGKTTVAEQVATALGLRFGFAGKTSDEVKLTGYMDGHGNYRETEFRRCYEHGGVFLFDEIDGWAPDALLAMNAPLAGSWADFPDRMVRKHKDFVAIAAANTFGRGADRQYVGREQLDAATLDRFPIIEMDYDEELERNIARSMGVADSWTDYVQKVRKAVFSEKGIRMIVSPRATFGGGVMLKAGEKLAEVQNAFIWKGIDETTQSRVKAAMR